MKKNNRICAVCGKVYTFCPQCSSGKEPYWKVMFHDENCRNIFNAIMRYSRHDDSAIEARAALNKCDLNIDLDTTIVRDIAKIDAELAEIMPTPVVEETVIVHEEAEESMVKEPAAKTESKPHKRMEKKPKK